MNATSEPSILTDRPVSTPVPNFQTKVSLPPASEALVAFRDTENYANEMTGPPAEMTVTQFQSVDLKVTVAPSLLHVGALSFPASFTANFATPETKYRHAFPFPLPSIMTSATARC